uniref:Ig-like domain-containing protein n=1 Tax=Anas platyrhynchos platyrhynchos TaxID=8840 RepID=A0A493TNK9_ANAPP
MKIVLCAGHSLSPVFSPLFSPSPVSLVQAVLTQLASKSVNLGGTVQITCSRVSSSYAYGWYQQKTPGSAPVTVIYWNDRRPSGIPSQFSASTSGSTSTLTITGVQAEDEAVYDSGSQDSSASAGSLVQAALTQSEPQSVNPGGTVQITCSGGSSYYGSYSYGWYQQKTPGSAPVTVIYNNNQRPSDIPSRFSGSKSSSTAMLTITGVQAEDEAVYYCGGYDSSASADADTVTQSNGEVIQKPSNIAGAAGFLLSSRSVAQVPVSSLPLEPSAASGSACCPCSALPQNPRTLPFPQGWDGPSRPIPAPNCRALVPRCSQAARRALMAASLPRYSHCPGASLQGLSLQKAPRDHNV